MKILLGISGSIAAYRSPDFVKELKAQGHEVRVVLTASAAQFVSAKVLETFAGTKVASSDVFSNEHHGTEHIAWARWADEIIVYGATATTLARLACASGEDFLSLQILAFKGKPILVPAMNTAMWENPLVQANVQKLSSAGYIFVGPVAGDLACGEKGLGHIADHKMILAQLAPKKAACSAKRVFITGGPMRTAIDPVRYVQNQSSGEMSVALAESFRDLGFQVTLALGPVDSSIVERAKRACDQLLRFESYPDYESVVNKEFRHCDVFVSAAAVLDFDVVTEKQKRSRESLAKAAKLELPIQATSDQVARLVKQKKAHQQIVAFSLESGPLEHVLERARRKLIAKGVDWMIANRAEEMLTPGTTQFKIWLLGRNGVVLEIQATSKSHLARALAQTLSSNQNPTIHAAAASEDRTPRA